MQELHGLVGVRCTRDAGEWNDTQSIRIHVHGDTVVLLHTRSQPCGLTPDEARYIADRLIDAAARAEAAKTETPET